MEKEFNLLLIVPKYETTEKKDYTYWFPLSLGYVVASLKKNGYKVDCLNLNHFDGKIKNNINAWLDKKKYDFVLTGGMVMNYAPVKLVIDTAKSHCSQPKIILGGTIITATMEIIFKDLKPDFGIIGEAEETLIELFKSLENNKDLKKVAGIVYLENGEMIFTGKRTPKLKLDDLPFPDYGAIGYDEFLENTKPSYSYWHSIFDYPRMYNLIGSRSCPFSCTFCWHYGNYRERSIKNIMEEIEHAIDRFNINLVFVNDECISLNKKRLIEFCDSIAKLRKRKNIDLRWIGNLRVEVVDEPTLKKMKDAGCYITGYGLESYSDKVLKSMNKKITPEQIKSAIKMTMDYKMSIQGSFIFGDPAETFETADETLNYWRDYCEGQAHLSFVKPFPHSAIYQYCLDKGIIKDRLKHIVNINDYVDVYENMTSLTDKEFNNLRKKVSSYLTKYRKLVHPLSVNKSGDGTYELDAECPYCKKINCYKNFKIENRFFFGYLVLCRDCMMKYYVVNNIKGVFFKHYDIFRDMRDKYYSVYKKVFDIKQNLS
jgi:anaerobic magnesium-protoporphyrin IX monomethyl ester cyclase